MKRLAYVLVAVLVIMTSFPMRLAFAQKALPKVPITYAGDTDKTIARRAEWIEGAKKEGTLVWWGILNPKEKIAVMAEFNKVYPFIKLEGWRGGPTETASKLESDWATKRYSCDVSSGGSYNLARWRQMGMLQKFVDIIPGIEKRHKRSYSASGDAAYPGAYVTAPQYNTKLVPSAEAPKGWEDLLAPKWKGQVGIVPEMKHWWTLALDGGWGLAKVEEFLGKLAKQGLVWGPGNSALHALLVAGEFRITATGYIRHVILSQEKGAPAEWVRAKPLMVFPSDTYLPQRGPNPNATRLFVEWLFSPQGLAVYEDVTGVGSVDPASGSKISKAVAGLPLAYETEEVLAKAINLRLEERFSKILGVPK